MHSRTGVLTFTTAPDFDVPTDANTDNVYEVTVQEIGSASSRARAISVTVTNVNEAPTITSDGGGATASKSIPENTTAVTDVDATDPDAGTTLVYSTSVTYAG